MRTNTRIFPRIFPRLFERDASLAGFGLVDSGALLSFHAAWADAAGVSQPLLVGTSPVTTTHAEAILAPDFEGVYREFDVDEPVWKDGRVVENELLYSEDFSNAVWSKIDGATVNNDNDVTLPTPLVTCKVQQVVVSPNVLVGDTQLVVFSFTLTEACTIRTSIWRSSGTSEGSFEDVPLLAGDHVLTTNKEWAYASHTGYYVYISNSPSNSGSITLYDLKAQSEHTTGRSDTTTPSEYIATTTALVQKVFNYANVNTVDANGVVTEDRGSDFADAPYLVAQPAGTNSQIQSNDQTNAEYTATNVTVAQDESGFATGKDACTLTATAANGTVIANAIVAASGEHAAKWYIKRKTGTGDIDLTLDNGTGWTTVTLTSDFDLFAIDQAALTNPQIGIRIVTDTDAVIVGNAECHLTSTVEEVKSLGPIFTTIAEATTSAFDNEYPAANHSNTEGPYYLEFENTGDDVALLSAGTDEFLKITSNQLILDDGTTQISTACAAGEHKVGVAFDADNNLMNLNLDDSWETQAAYDDTLGSGVLTLGDDERNVKRWNETDLTKQKDIIDREMA